MGKVFFRGQITLIYWILKGYFLHNYLMKNLKAVLRSLESVAYFLKTKNP